LEDRKPIASYVSGSWEFIESIVLELSKIGIRSKKLIYVKLAKRWHFGPLTVHEYKGRRGYYIKMGGKNIEKLFHYFYDDVPESQYLKRKYDIFQSSLERV